jgi:putative ABC transport system permease protein
MQVLVRHKWRTLLTALGVFWGIFLLIVLLGAGSSLRAGAVRNFGGVTNVVYLWSGRPTQLPYKGFATGRVVGLTLAERDFLRERLPEAARVLEVNELGGWQAAQYIVRKGKSGSYGIQGAHAQTAALANYRAIAGRFINERDYAGQRKVAVIGPKVRQDLFAGEDPIGEALTIAGVVFTVVGVFEPQSGGANNQRDASRILLPNSTLRAAFNQQGWIGSLRLQPKPGISAAEVEAKALSLLKTRLHFHPDEKSALGSYNTERDYLKVVALFDGLRYFSWFVALGTLLAGCIGVGNILLIAVKERRRELGLRKALGATPASLMAQIIQEALVLMLIAGGLGVIAGVWTLEGLALWAATGKVPGFGPPSISLTVVLAALSALIVMGVAAASWPARQAARVNPIIALQAQ